MDVNLEINDMNAELAGIKIGQQYPIRIMGVLNVSPESFFKGSVSVLEDSIMAKAAQMVADGADILDIGARGTAPYLKTNITVEEEADRMVTAIRAVRRVTNKPISADTQTASVAKAALHAGANILNDISGLAHDPALATVARQFDGTILMANGDYTNVVGKPITVVKASLKAVLERALQAGLPANKIILDPGIGFFRGRQISWDDWDRVVLQGLSEFQMLKRPIVVGISRKSFIGKVLDYSDASDRLYASLGLTSLLVGRGGVHLVRTHDVLATRDAVRIAEWFRQK